LSDTSVIFAAVQKLALRTRADSLDITEDDATSRAVRKLALDYVNFCKEVWIHTSQPINRSEALQFSNDHYRQLYNCFSLFAVLYLPDPAMEHAPVGEELMEWLNTHFIEPSTEEGDHLSTLERPWEDETFWPYLARTTLRGLSKASAFFLGVLSKHPSPHLQRLSQHLIPLLTDHPRLHQFSAERDFAIASRRWKDKVKVLRVELDRVPEDARDDGFENWWDQMSSLVGVLEGRHEVLKRLCIELGADWKEVCVAWGVFIDGRLRRQDLPDTVRQVLDDMPSDPTNLEDAIHSALFLGKPHDALAEAAKLDIWLAAHLADLMQIIDLIDREVDNSEIPLRDRYILSYAGYLRSDPACWRITVDYLMYCGDVGKEMADTVLLRVPLRLKGSNEKTEDAARIRAGDVTGVLKEINEACFYYGREEVRRMACKIVAQTFLREKEYGLAVSYCTSAEDWAGLGRLVECILNEYIDHGPALFAKSVADIAPSLQTLRSHSGANGVFVYRLKFAVRFAEFHQRKINGDLQEAAFDVVSMFQEDIAPKLWWAVILCDAVDLLQNNESLLFSASDTCLLLHKLQEITTCSSQGAAADYLPVLARTIKNGDEKQALQRLQIVRLALARYYARCSVIGVGGKFANERNF